MSQNDQWPDEWPEAEKIKNEQNSQPQGDHVFTPILTTVALMTIGFFIVAIILLSPKTDPIIVRTTPSPTPTRWIVQRIITATPAPYRNSEPDWIAGRHSCTIDINENWHNCHHLNAIQLINQPYYNTAVARITLDPFTTGYEAAEFEIFYADEIDGWTVNIGDSSTNNGMAGDADTQTNDAELQIHDGRLDIFGNDNTPPNATTDGHRHIYGVDEFANPYDQINLRVGNGRVDWQGEWADSHGEVESPYLYALARQPDKSGNINHDIYAAFNQTVAGDRFGNGVTHVHITLVPAQN